MVQDNHKIRKLKVSGIDKHPNADRLEMIRLEDVALDVIYAKGKLSIGDMVLLFPESSILPNSMIEYFDLKFLKNGKVRTTKLLGAYSQALILPIKDVAAYYMALNGHKLPNVEDYYELLGITRPVEIEEDVTGGNLSEGLKRYDLLNAEHSKKMYEFLASKSPVSITEKIEGTHFTVTAEYQGSEIVINFHSKNLMKRDGLYVNIPKHYGIDEIAKKVLNMFPMSNMIAIRGELYGEKIQGNYYGIKGVDYAVFSIEVDGNAMPQKMFKETIAATGLKRVPVIFEGNLLDYAETPEALKEKSDGQSVIADKLREGIVIYTNDSAYAIKQRSPLYLSKQKD